MSNFQVIREQPKMPDLQLVNKRPLHLLSFFLSALLLLSFLCIRLPEPIEKFVVDLHTYSNPGATKQFEIGAIDVREKLLLQNIADVAKIFFNVLVVLFYIAKKVTEKDSQGANDVCKAYLSICVSEELYSEKTFSHTHNSMRHYISPSIIDMTGIDKGSQKLDDFYASISETFGSIILNSRMF